MQSSASSCTIDVDPARPLWVFGYGSLIWSPDFPVAERRIGRVQGWRRSFCMWSVHHRGTVDRPGLVLALQQAPAAGCEGVALRVTPGAEAETLALLRERELVSSAYLERMLAVDPLDGSGRVQALAYVMDAAHPQHAGSLGLEEQARIILAARGRRGENRDYLWSTVHHLGQLGIGDGDLEWLAGRVRELAAEENPS